MSEPKTFMRHNEQGVPIKAHSIYFDRVEHIEWRFHEGVVTGALVSYASGKEWKVPREIAEEFWASVNGEREVS